MGLLLSFPWHLPHSSYSPRHLPHSSYSPIVSTFGELSWSDAHADDAVSLLLEQFKGMPLVEGYVASFANRIQELEDATWAVLLATDPDIATDAQLDGIGALVGEGRKERSDALYRSAIRIRILVNRCNGTHAEILRILTLYLGIADGAGTVELREPAAAALSLNVLTLPESTSDLAVIVRAIKPGGVNLDARVETSATRAARFGWDGGSVTGQTSNNWFGWDGDASVGGLFATEI